MEALHDDLAVASDSGEDWFENDNNVFNPGEEAIPRDITRDALRDIPLAPISMESPRKKSTQLLVWNKWKKRDQE